MIWRLLLQIKSDVLLFIAGVLTSVPANLFTSLIFERPARTTLGWWVWISILDLLLSAFLFLLVAQAVARKERLTEEHRRRQEKGEFGYTDVVPEDLAVAEVLSKTNFKCYAVLSALTLLTGIVLILNLMAKLGNC